MDNLPDKSKVDELNEVLNSRTRYEDPALARKNMEPAEAPSVKEGWQSPDLDEMLAAERRLEETSPFMKKLFVFAVLFFMAAVLIAGYVFFGGSNFISSKNVDITVVGPTEISAGETLELGVTVKNKNNADLELANLSVQYPQGARNPDDMNQSLTYTKESLGEIGAGDEAVKNVRAILFGASGEVIELKFTVEYKVRGSNATFYKDKVYEVAIGEAPLTLVVESPDSAVSGESFETRIQVELDSPDILKDVMVRGEYPYGYSLIRSEPGPLANNNVWSLGDLMPGSKKTIRLEGKLLGENSEERTFRFYAGVSDAGGTNPNFRTIIASAQETVAISRPSIGLSVRLNGDRSDPYLAPVAGTVNAGINFSNNLPAKLVNPRLEARLSGSALDRFSVIAENGGFYDSSQNKIVWDIRNMEDERELNPGDTGQVTFRFSSLGELPAGASAREIKVAFTMSGTSVDTNRPVTVSETRTVRISSEANLSSRALYSLGAFTNTGPIPPKADEETTYTIVMNVGNTGTELKNSRVTAKLGQNVRWLRAEGGEDIEYNEGSNVITWDIDTLSGGSGFSSAGREAAFQVSLKPSISQIGTSPVLVSSITFTGSDAETGRITTLSNPSLTTNITSDPQFVQGDGTVTR